jgi:intracellular septation protein
VELELTVMNHLVKLILDLGPLVVFFLTYYLLGIMTATGVFMGATLLAAAASYYMFRKVSPLMIFSGVFVLIFGTLTLVLKDTTFIKMKPTAYYLLVAGMLSGGLLFKRLLLKDVMDLAMQITDEGWRKLTIRIAIFFLVMAGLNEFIWRSYSESTWVWLKVWGFIPLTFVFFMAQTPLIMRHEIKNGEDAPTDGKN